MANFYGSCRSYYFSVKNMERFKEEVAHSGLDLILNHSAPALVGVTSTNDSGTWPSELEVEDKNGDCDYIDFDVVEFIQGHLADNSICVLMECGAEKLRYLVGTAMAFTNNEIVSHVNMADVYSDIESACDLPYTKAEY